MSRILVTGSSDGIGAEIVRTLAAQGHEVIAHARNEQRARECGATSDLVIGDLASVDSTGEMIAALRGRAPLDVVVHNAGWASHSESRELTGDGLEKTFQIHVLAPYLLTAALPLPQRLVFVNSDSIVRGNLDVADLQHEQAWTSAAAYADSKLAQAVLALGLARRYPAVRSNAVHPGWVSTKMSNYQAPLDVAAGADTPAWLATSDEATVSGAYFQDRIQVRLNEQMYDEKAQDALLNECANLTGASLPAAR